MTTKKAERAALAISHPGHELRLMKWINDTRPLIFLLTCGSRGGASRSRVSASQLLATQLGATPGPIFGERQDREVYEWILAENSAPFLALANRMATSFVEAQITTVITDSWQLYNVVHDLWHLTVRIAAAEAAISMGSPLACLDYPVVPHTSEVLGPGSERHRLTLTPQEVDDKLRLASEFPEIADDVAEVMRIGGPEIMQQEVLYAVRPVGELPPTPGAQALYERFGEERVAAGLYASVLRWSHVEPTYHRLCARLLELEGQR